MLIVLMWAVLLLGMCGGVASPARASKAVDKLAARFGLPQSEPLRSMVLQRYRARERSRAWGAAAGIGVGVLLAALLQLAHASASAAALAFFACAGLGAAVGTFIGSRVEWNSIDGSAARVARARAATVADYSSRGESLATWVSIATVAVAVTVAWLLWAMVPLRPGAGTLLIPLAVSVAGLLGASVLVGLQWSTRRIVARPLRASSEDELAWEEVLRGVAVRYVQSAVCVGGMMLVLLILGYASTWLIRPEVRARDMALTQNLGVCAFAAGMLCWFAVAALWASGSGRDNPARRPGMPAGALAR